MDVVRNLEDDRVGMVEVTTVRRDVVGFIGLVRGLTTRLFFPGG